jgi:excisionase family DNA binding protein
LRRSDLPPRLLSARQVAEYVGVDVRTVRRWEAEGLLPAVRLTTGTVRFTPEAVELLVGTENTSSPGPQNPGSTQKSDQPAQDAAYSTQ